MRGPVVAPQSFGGVPQCPTREEYALLKARMKEIEQKELADGPAAIANGGTIIADAYSS